jgi:signal transduction histidine kinase/tetratricopeptide (TPR) repeat protein
MKNLRIALAKQKKLVALFIVTIFLPSVLLSVFGIRAIRNEKFRLEREIENQNRRIAGFLKNQLISRFEEISSDLKSVTEDPSFIQKDYASIRKLVNGRFQNDLLIEQIFLNYGTEEYFFPFLQPISTTQMPAPGLSLNDSARKLLKQAQESEYQKRDYTTAIARYKTLIPSAGNRNTRAIILNHIARNYKKQSKYHQAAETYLQVVRDFPESRASSGLPLVIPAELQIAECYNSAGDFRESLTYAFRIYKQLLDISWDLTEDQFVTYASLAQEAIRNSRENLVNEFTEVDRNELERLTRLHINRVEQFQIRKAIIEEIVPDLRNMLGPVPNAAGVVNLSKTIDSRLFLVSAVPISENSKGILGILYNQNHLIKSVLPEIIRDIQRDEETDIAITDLSGIRLVGSTELQDKEPILTEYFEANFPPWKITLYTHGTAPSDMISITRNFYFWTIITLIIVLVFGAVMINRAMAHEQAALKIKSDFVSSVSHEFKTPLTSIRTLTERMKNGKIKDPAKMQTYFSIISHDVDRLARLVSNVLNFSKIEEGRKEYEFQDTDTTEWISQTVNEYRETEIEKEINIHLNVAENIPRLKMDPDALSQAVYNLLDNAIKFSDKKDRIDVLLTSNKLQVILKITDRGIGIDSEDLNHIFDKFYQGKNALEKSVQGTGLGLTLVKHAIEAHGGKISIESSVGKGTTFSIQIPFQLKM